jgi:preprotein translocase subunit SecA
VVGVAGRGPAPASAVAVAEQAQDQGQALPSVSGQVVKTEHEKLGRNDPCWCGSGKKFKLCHGR